MTLGLLLLKFQTWWRIHSNLQKAFLISLQSHKGKAGASRLKWWGLFPEGSLKFSSTDSTVPVLVVPIIDPVGDSCPERGYLIFCFFSFCLVVLLKTCHTQLSHEVSPGLLRCLCWFPCEHQSANFNFCSCVFW